MTQSGVVDERNVLFEVVEVKVEPTAGRIVVVAVGRGGRLGALRLRQSYSASSPYSRGKLRRLLEATAVAVDEHGSFLASELVGQRFVADVTEDPRPSIGFVWANERAGGAGRP